MKLKKKNKRLLLQAALGKIKVDLAIKNIQLLNTITGEIYPATVFVHDGFIVHVEDKDLTADLDNGKEIVDGQGQFLTPGLIDAHVHIESSMMIPRTFAEASLPHGTTTVITDPHEIANVYGVEGVKYMHDSSDGLPQRQLINIPSCVPSVPDLEYAGATFMSEDIIELAKLERVIGLAEVMDYVGVINGEDRMMDIIEAAENLGLYIQGHTPFVTGKDLSAYLVAGPNTCHETRVSSEALEKMRKGMFVDARDSSLAKNVTDIINGIKNVRYFDHLCLCTDDRESDEILNIGHMNDVVRNAIKSGLHPIDAYRAASYNIAREIKADDIGAIAPGFIADMLLIPDLEKVEPSHVFFEGKLVASNNKLIVPISTMPNEIETRNSINTKRLTLEDFIIKVDTRLAEVSVNIINYPDSRISSSELIVETLKVIKGKIDISHDDDLKYIAVVNRHNHNDKIGLGIVRGFGTNQGCLASTVSHDSHNLVVVYDNPENALIAANELIRVGGGQTGVLNSQVLHTLELRVAGLMSTKPAGELAIDANAMKAVNRKLGLTKLENPLLRIVAMALIVIPKFKMSELGIVDVLNKKVIKTLNS
ncbi:MAG: adenine deaminase [Erysipelothrix sp.]|nr:adenine deaminase [Erysipelothrix sp.]